MSIATLYSKLGIVKNSIDHYNHIDQAPLLALHEKERTMTAHRIVCFHNLRSLIDEATIELIKSSPNDIKEFVKIVGIAMKMAKVENINSCP